MSSVFCRLRQKILRRHLPDGTAQLFEGAFLDARNIAARQTEAAGDFMLRQGGRAAKTVAQTDDFPFARTERRRKCVMHGRVAVVVVHRRQSLVLAADGVAEAERTAFAVGFERIRQRNLACGLSFAAEVHQQLVLDAARSVGRELDAALRPERIHRLDEADRPDGNQIVPFRLRGIVFLDDVRHEPQVVLDEQTPRLGVTALRKPPQQLGLLGCGKRLWEAAVRTLHAQDKEEKRSSERRQRRYKQKKNPFPCVLLPVYAGRPENSTED